MKLQFSLDVAAALGAIVLLSPLLLVSASFAPHLTEIQQLDPIAKWNTPNDADHATLYAAHAPDYDDPIYVLNITSSDHRAAGYGYGYLLANQSIENFEALLNSLLPQKDLQVVLEAFCAWQFQYIQENLPRKFVDEIEGITQGTMVAGLPIAGKYIKLALAVASIAVGDLERDILYLLKSEIEKDQQLIDSINQLHDQGMSDEDIAHAISSSNVLNLGRTCSMFGVWGPRTYGGQLFSGRNLDWAADTGIARNKLITVYHIRNTIPYATVSFSGLIGALTGMSAAGVTVHEAGDDTRNVTLEGFAWPLRLRAVMETARSMSDVLEFWKATNNTMGINHGVGTAADPRFLAMETEAKYTAYFFDNDPRERDLVIDGVKYGFPLPHALWRTNHGYDPQFLKDVFSKKPSTDSFNRYMLLHDTFTWYEDASVEISDIHAVNLTAIVGDKGGSTRESFLSCKDASSGINILSTTFKPSAAGAGTMYVAYENGHADTHVPACCNNYIKFEMDQFFGV
eukprot:gene1154-4373_t